jgi:hypothetical protein
MRVSRSSVSHDAANATPHEALQTVNPYVLPSHWPTQSRDVSPHPVGRDAAMRLGISPLAMLTRTES